MSKQLLGKCEHCGAGFHFPALSIGEQAPCPHCGQPTELALAPVAEQPTVPRRALIWTLVAVLILGGGVYGAMVALKRAQNWAAQQHSLTNQPPAEGEAK